MSNIPVMNELAQLWLNRLEQLDIAFQPIVNIHTGVLYGVEALLRGVEQIGYESIMDFFDDAYEEGILYTLSLALREKVIKKFTRIENYKNIKLFINLDNRLLEMADFSAGNTAKILDQYGLHKEMICFELSERHEISDVKHLENMLEHYKSEHYSIAIDDFGTGYAGYKLLHQSTPDIIKIDRFFMGSICQDKKKRIMVRGIVSLATQLGITVIAEGVETASEVLVCRQLGCHLVQGYFVQKPTLLVNKIRAKYGAVKEVLKKERRTSSCRSQIKEHLEYIEPVTIRERMQEVLQRFKLKRDDMVVPIVDRQMVPVGILDEHRVKDMVSTPFGHALLSNDSLKNPKIKKYVQKCAIADINVTIDTLIECFSNFDDATGVIITKNMKYYGYLSARAIINIINEYNLVAARDQNPLTKLPGNHLIDNFISEALALKQDVLLAYFDFNNFKVFNDCYGFRKGDRAIQLFADLLRKNLPKEFFKGHIGGDDFFVGITVGDGQIETYVKMFQELCAKFAEEVKSFYDQKERAHGFVKAKGRDGIERKFELLNVSGVVVEVSRFSTMRALDLLHKHFSEQKKVAKSSSDMLNVTTML